MDQVNVYTYYENIPGLWSDESQRALLKVWSRSWEKSGWTPVVLNESSVRSHPQYESIKDKLRLLPTEYGLDYERACFLRWLSVSKAGGGMLVDYDVINYGFTPLEPDPEKMVVFSDEPFVMREVMSFSMGAVLGTAQQYLEMIKIFSNWVPGEQDKNKYRVDVTPEQTLGGPEAQHCNDMTMLVQMLIKKNHSCPEWLKIEPGCARFNTPLGKTSPLVHYNFFMKAAGFWPKDEWIEKLRPL